MQSLLNREEDGKRGTRIYTGIKSVSTYHATNHTQCNETQWEEEMKLPSGDGAYLGRFESGVARVGNLRGSECSPFSKVLIWD